MLSLNSPHEPTKVINSRASTKKPVVWRRRQGIRSGLSFTTYERPSLAENKPIRLTDNKTDAFNLGRLILSIAGAFSHDKHAAQYDSLWLALTIEEKLSIAEDEFLTRDIIAQTTYSALKRFDGLAAMQYAAKHRLISNVRQHGRPSIR